MKQIYVSPSAPIHVSATGPIYLLSPTGIALRQHRQQRAWLTRRVQTLLLAALAAISLVVLLHPMGTSLPTQDAPLASRRAGASRPVDSRPAGSNDGQQKLLSDSSSSSNSPPPVQLSEQRQQQHQLQQEAVMLMATASTDLADAPLPTTAELPVHVCCMGVHCLSTTKQRHAVVTYVRSQAQLQAAQALASSLWRTNPGLDLAVMLVRGELPAGAADAVEGLNATIFYVDPLAGATRTG